MRNVVLVILILIGMFGCTVNKRRAPEIIDQIELNYTYNDSIRFNGEYVNGDLVSYVVTNIKEGTVKSEMKVTEANEKIEIYYGNNLDTMYLKRLNPKGVLTYECLRYSNGALNKEIRLKNGLYDTSYYQIDGVTQRIKKNILGDSTFIFEADSIGAKVEELKYYYRELVECKRYSNDQIVFHSIRNKGKNDTIIDRGFDNGRRSANDIMKVVKAETPKLRSLYNKYLIVYGFNSKITLKFEINKYGDIEYIYPIRFTTSTPLGFINDLVKKIGSWKYSKIAKGNVTVSIPFTFSE